MKDDTSTTTPTKTKTTSIDPREVARLFLELTPEEHRALFDWHGEWVTPGGEYSVGDWPGWAAVIERLGEAPDAASPGGGS